MLPARPSFGFGFGFSFSWKPPHEWRPSRASLPFSKLKQKLFYCSRNSISSGISKRQVNVNVDADMDVDVDGNAPTRFVRHPAKNTPNGKQTKK